MRVEQVVAGGSAGWVLRGYAETGNWGGTAALFGAARHGPTEATRTCV
jgi:hypothetical protein